MNASNLAAMVLATSLWLGLAVLALGGSSEPNPGAWRPTHVAKGRNLPTPAPTVAPVIVLAAPAP